MDALFADIRDKVADYPNLVFDLLRMKLEDIDKFQSDFWFIAACLLNVPEEKIRERFDQMKHAVETMSLLSFLTGNDRYMKAMEEFEKWL